MFLKKRICWSFKAVLMKTKTILDIVLFSAELLHRSYNVRDFGLKEKIFNLHF